MVYTKEGARPAWPKNSIVTKPDGTIAVEWNRAGLCDEHLERFVAGRLAMLITWLPTTEEPIECTLDFSGNELREAGPIQELMQRLRDSNVHVTSLRLHQNRFGDGLALALADHMCCAASASKPFMQLHLSNNEFTAAGVDTLVRAAHQCGAYPRPRSAPIVKSLGKQNSWRRALWLRIENQQPPIPDPAGLLRGWRDAGFPVCVLQAHEKRVPDDAVVQMPSEWLDAKGIGKGVTEQVGMKGKNKGRNGNLSEKQFKGGCTAEERKPVKLYSSESRTGKKKSDDVWEQSSCAASVDNRAAMEWLRTKRTQGVSNDSFEQAWMKWCSDQPLCEQTKEKKQQRVADFREYWVMFGDISVSSSSREISSALDVGTSACVAKSSTQDATSIEDERAAENPVQAIKSSPPDLALSRAAMIRDGGDAAARLDARAVQRKIKQAGELGALKGSLKPERKPREWKRLSDAGREALAHMLAKRASETLSTFLNKEEIAAICNECSSGGCLAAAYRALEIDSLFSGNLYMRGGEDVAFTAKMCAVLGDLYEGGVQLSVRDELYKDVDQEREASRAAALCDLRDLILLMGFVRLGYENGEDFFASVHDTVAPPSTKSFEQVSNILPGDTEPFCRFSILTAPIVDSIDGACGEIDSDEEEADYDAAIAELQESFNLDDDFDFDAAVAKGKGKGKGKRKGKIKGASKGTIGKGRGKGKAKGKGKSKPCY